MECTIAIGFRSSRLNNLKIVGFAHSSKPKTALLFHIVGESSLGASHGDFQHANRAIYSNDDMMVGIREVRTSGGSSFSSKWRVTFVNSKGFHGINRSFNSRVFSVKSQLHTLIVVKW